MTFLLWTSVDVPAAWVGIAKPAADLWYILRPWGLVLMTQEELLLQAAEVESFHQSQPRWLISIIWM